MWSIKNREDESSDIRFRKQMEYLIHFWTLRWKKKVDKIEVTQNGVESGQGPRNINQRIQAL